MSHPSPQANSWPFLSPLVERGTVDLKNSAVCIGCGCTNARACAGGCFWVAENKCSECFDEDGNRARKDNAPENLAILRRLALNILQSHPDSKPIRRKIKRAGWDDAFLLAMLGHMR